MKIDGPPYYLWRALDSESEILENYVTKTRDKSAALRLFNRAMKRYGAPRIIVTDLLRSYGTAMKEIGMSTVRRSVDTLTTLPKTVTCPSGRQEQDVEVQTNIDPAEILLQHASFYNHFNLDLHLNHRPIFKSKRDAAPQEWRQLPAT